MAHTYGQKETTDPDSWTEAELSDWYDRGEWKQGWEAVPDKSVNRREFARQFFRNPARWKKAFAFLQNQDLAALEVRRHDLEGPSLFVNVDQYTTRDEADSRFEAHRKYADIQYVVSGEERIGLTPLRLTTVTVPYDSGNDISFLAADEGTFLSAEPGRFFVFFPGDAHRPGVKNRERSQVRKIVVKVSLD